MKRHTKRQRPETGRRIGTAIQYGLILILLAVSLTSATMGLIGLKDRAPGAHAGDTSHG